MKNSFVLTAGKDLHLAWTIQDYWLEPPRFLLSAGFLIVLTFKRLPVPPPQLYVGG